MTNFHCINILIPPLGGAGGGSKNKELTIFVDGYSL